MDINSEESTLNIKEKYFRKLKVLNETIWEKKSSKTRIDAWLANFKPEERLEALYLLTQFTFFSEYQIEILLKSLYRDIFKYNFVSKIRLDNADTLDQNLIDAQYKVKLKRTRFVSLGNPSESSSLLLNIFRKTNNLPKTLFISDSEINEKMPEIDQFVFIDDICGSGTQAVSYSSRVIPKIKKQFPEAKVWYLMLVASQTGKEKILNESKFDIVDSILDLDSSFKCFEVPSRIFVNKDDVINVERIKEFCGRYGKNLMYSILKKDSPGISEQQLLMAAEEHKYGFSNGQFLVGFHHNTPDNTLPIIWYNEPHVQWNPIFKRANKVYEL